jgi:hypothetical protein
MADRKDVLLTELVLSGSSGTQIGRTVRVPSCDSVVLSVVATVTAATLQATLGLTGTNDDARAFDTGAVLPALTSAALISVVPGTVTFSTTTGLLTFNNLGIGTQEIVIDYTGFTKWVRPVWTFTSGGGVVSVAATIAAWST